MTPARWERVQRLFHAAAERDRSEGRTFLEAECGEDGELLADVLALLEEDARAHALLDHGVAHAASRVLDAGLHAAVPRALGRYRIVRVLGEGGMGIVYLAERDDLGNRVAVKVLRDAWLTPARRERFANEQRVLARLNHPSIARIYDADVLADGTPWFAMEYVEGVPITEYCRVHECSIPERLRLIREVGEAVLHAHQHLVIHRDLKPSNIFVKADGTVKLLDFGIARQLASADVAAVHTRTGLRLMTPAYAAPERLRDDTVGIQADVYSLGVILYELLTDRLPFDLSNLSALEAEALILEHVPVKPSALARVTAPETRQASRRSWVELDVLCPTAMHKDPARRYRTVEALIRDIDHYLAAEPLEARPDTLGYRVDRFLRRNRRHVAVGSAALALLVGLVAFYTVRLARSRDAALAEALRTQRIQRFTLSLFEGGDTEAGPAHDLRVITLLDRGLQEAHSLDREPEMQAALYETLGGIYGKLGHLDRADELLRAALEARRSLHGAEHPDVAESLLALGLLRLEQARYDEAEGLLQDALAMSERVSPPGHPARARATSALGTFLAARGQYDHAIEVLEEAVRLREAREEDGAGPDPDLATSLFELASAHFYAGHYPLSESLNERVLAMNRRLHGQTHPSVAGALVNLGAIQFELGRYARAEEQYREALAITESWYGSDHFQTAAGLTMLARALVFQGRSDEAIEPLERALAIRARIYGPVHPSVASTLNELGNIAVVQDRFADAKRYFERVLEIYRAVHERQHSVIGVALSNLGSAYMSDGDSAKAESLFREALEICAKSLSPDHLQTGITRIKLGRALLRQGRYSEAERETHAGHEILSKQADASVSFLRAARNDLVRIYEALGEPAKAEQYRARLAESAIATADGGAPR